MHKNCLKLLAVQYNLAPTHCHKHMWIYAVIVLVSLIGSSASAYAKTYFDFRSSTGTAVTTGGDGTVCAPDRTNCKYVVINLGRPTSDILGEKYYQLNVINFNIMGGGCTSGSLDIAVYNDAEYTSLDHQFGLASSGANPLPGSSSITFDVPATKFAQLIFGCNDSGVPPISMIDGGPGVYQPRDINSITYSGLPNLCIGDTPADCGATDPAVSYRQTYVNTTGSGNGNIRFVVNDVPGLATHAFWWQQQNGPCIPTPRDGEFAFYLGGQFSNYFYIQNCDGIWVGDGQYHWTMYDFSGNSPCGDFRGPCGTFSFGDWSANGFFIFNGNGGAYLDPQGNVTPALVLQGDTTPPPQPQGLPITVSHADTLLIEDDATDWGASSDFHPIFSPFTLTPPSTVYHAQNNFTISRIHIGVNGDGSSNNHDLVGNVRTWLFTPDGSVITSSINTCYGEGACGGRDLVFPPTTLVPQDFALSFITDDGLQGDAGWNLAHIGIYAENPHPAVSGLRQFSADGTAAIAEGSTVSGSGVMLKGTLQSASNDPLAFQVEVEPLGTPFINIATGTSAIINSGQTAFVTVTGLNPGQYHWQARSIDTTSLIASPWQQFGTNVAFILRSGLPLASSLGPPNPTLNPQATVAEPVSTGNGNYFYQHTDFVIPGRGLPIDFTRTYNARDSYIGPLGANWTHSYNVILREAGDGNVTIRWGDGHSEIFALSGKIYVSQPGVVSRLTNNSDGTFVLTKKDLSQYSFSDSGRLVSIQDRNGNAVTLTYDASSNLTLITSPGRQTLTLAYDTTNRIIQVSDSLGRAVSFTYNASNDLASSADQAGGVMAFAYDTDHRVLSITQPTGKLLLTNTYDVLGRVISQTNGRGFVTGFAYDTPTPGSTTVTDARNNKTIHTYDSQLRILQIKDSLGGTVSYTYDGNNNRTNVTNQSGKATAFSYDGQGNITAIADPTGNKSLFGYDAKNNLLDATDAKGNVTAFGYDGNGNLISIADSLGNTTKFAYDAFGQLTAKTDAKGNSTAYLYNSFGNLIKISDALGHSTGLAYDAISRLTTVTDANGHAASSAYDALSRLVNITDSLGHQTQFAYDAVGNLLVITDANGNATHYEYDSVNDLTAVTDALGHVTRYTYDENNNRSAFINAKGNTTLYTFDSLNRLSSVADPLSFVTAYTYDAIGNVIAVKDANGNTNRFAYDVLNRLVNISYGDGQIVTYSYDPNGNRTTMIDPHGTTGYTFDKLNRLLSVANPGGKTVQYQYNAVGNRQSVTYPDGKVVAYAYDPVNRLSTVQDWLGRTTNYQYDPAGNLLSLTYPNHVGISFAYDNANRLTLAANSFLNASGKDDGGSRHFGVFEYLMDAVGNRLQVSNRHGKTIHYSYDKLYELTGVTTERSGGQDGDHDDEITASYEYDAVGNRIKQSSEHGIINYSYDAADRLLQAGDARYSFDANGNQISVTKAATSNPIAYRYDAANRLIAVTGGFVNSSFSYDGDGNRISQSAGSATFSYVNDIAAALPVVLQESKPDGDISYSYGLNLISESGNGFDNFYQYDGLGSIVGLTNAQGRLIQRYVYNSWGQTLRDISEHATGSNNQFGFISEMLDHGTGLYYLRARYYDPNIGRFLNRDPLPGSTRTPLMRQSYLYTGNNPVRFSDHSGLIRQEAAGEMQQPLSVLDFSLPNTVSNPRVAAQGTGNPFCAGKLDCADYLISAIGLRFEGPVGIGFAVTSFGIELRRDSADPNTWARWASLIIDTGELAVAVCSEFNPTCTAAEIALFAVDTLSRLPSTPDQLPITTPSVAMPIPPLHLR